MTYTEKRAQLMAQAQEAINSGDLEKFNELKAQIEALDAREEEKRTAQANLNALNGTHQAAANPAQFAGTQGVQLTDGAAVPADDMFNSLEYRRAFMNKMLKDTPIPAKFTNTDYTTTSTTAGRKEWPPSAGSATARSSGT